MKIIDLSPSQLSFARKKYLEQRRRSDVRNIIWDFTFESWIQHWLDSGQWFNRGTKGYQYCMARYNDKGPYSVDNTRILSNADNTRERSNRPLSIDDDFDFENHLKVTVEVDGINYGSIKQASKSLSLKPKQIVDYCNDVSNPKYYIKLY